MMFYELSDMHDDEAGMVSIFIFFLKQIIFTKFYQPRIYLNLNFDRIECHGYHMPVHIYF